MRNIFASLLVIVLTLGSLSAQEMATIYILRPYNYGAAMGAVYGGKKYYMFKHLIDIDDHKFGAVPTMNYFKIDVESGDHTFIGRVVKELTEEINLDNYQKQQPDYSITINAVAGEKYYLCIDEKKFEIAQIDKKAFEKELKKTFPVQYAGFVSFKGGFFYTQEGKLIDEKTGKIIEDQTGGLEQLAQVPKAKNQRNIAKSDVDQNIPATNIKNPNTFVLIIANEEYKNEINVEFAENDGSTFKEYCVKTLGIPAENIELKPNATIGDFYDGVDWLENVLNYIDGSKAIVFYSGHGINDEKTGDAYLIPVDGQAMIMATCFSLNNLYKKLSSTKSGDVTYFMDACFTGAGKDGTMLVAARGVAREPKKETLSGKTIVFSATNSDQTAMPYTEKSHGLFTYFLLKKLQETQGNVTYKELQDYLYINVNKYAVMINRKPQTPTVATSPLMESTWREKKLR